MEEGKERRAVEAALAGDTGGLGELFELHRARLERSVAFRLDSRLSGRIDPADVVQEAFTATLGRLDDFLAKRDMGWFLWLRLEVGTHLATLHRAHLGTLARDAGREVPLERPAGPYASSFAMASALLDASGTPSRAAQAQERVELLRAAIDGMKEADREVLSLRAFEQLTNQEVARLLGLTEPAATLRYVRALRRLRCVLDELGIASELPT